MDRQIEMESRYMYRGNRLESVIFNCVCFITHEMRVYISQFKTKYDVHLSKVDFTLTVRENKASFLLHKIPYL